jgi:hypothetical protein
VPAIAATKELEHAATDTLEGQKTMFTGHPVTGFGHLMPSNHTHDLRIRTENCDQSGGKNAVDDPDTSVCIFATTPEALTAPVSRDTIVAMTPPIAIKAIDMMNRTYSQCSKTDPLAGCGSYGRGLRFLCEAPASSSPYACDASGATSGTLDHDCYDVVHIGVWSAGTAQTPTGQLVSNKMKVIVANPKTSSAQVSRVSIEPPVLGPATDGLENDLFTPSVSGDGKLLVVGTPVGLQYAYSTNPCDVNGWTNFEPITELHTDPRGLRNSYGIARFPLRDAENNVLTATWGPPDPNTGKRPLLNSGLQGAYSWIDTKSNLMFFNYARGSSPWYWSGAGLGTRYDVFGIANVDGKTAPPDPAKAATSNQFLSAMRVVADRGPHDAMAVVGLWTNGKIIIPDTRLNKNTLGINGGFTYDVALYQSAPATHLITGDTRRKAGYENAFAHLPNARPDDPHDVVWKASTNQDSDEIAFDDFTTTDALIVSPMNPSSTYNSTTGENRVNDGYGPSDGDWTASGRDPMWIQNTATSMSASELAQFASDINPAFGSWKVPAHGELKGGGRIEPLTAGGTGGAGLYLNGANYLEYALPAQDKAMSGQPWFYSLWVDPRALGTEQVILAVQGAISSSLSLSATGNLILRAGGASSTFTIPAALAFASGRWTHVAISSAPNVAGSDVKLYINGYRLALTTLSVGDAFTPKAGGVISLGGLPGDAHLQAWVDDLRVIGRIPGAEELCRQARGTLVSVTSSDTSDWAYAGAYPAASHNAITKDLTKLASTVGSYGIATSTRYVCEVGISATAMPAGPQFCIADVRRPALQPNPAKCVGMADVFPEGPVIAGHRRPDATKNTFCTSCHDTAHPAPSLTIAHLAPSDTDGVHTDADHIHIVSEWDPRRQPMQPRQVMSGVIPKDMFCPGSPAKLGPTNTDVEMAACR